MKSKINLKLYKNHIFYLFNCNNIDSAYNLFINDNNYEINEYLI